MNNNNVFCGRLHKRVNALAALHQQTECWTVMIFPFGSKDLIIEWCCIIFNSTHVVYPEVHVMLLLDVVTNGLDVISVHFLPEVSSWKAHCYNSRRNISQVQVILSFFGPASFARHYLAQVVHISI